MTSTTMALRAGFTRGLIELRHSFSGADLFTHLCWPLMTLVAVFFLRNLQFRHSGFTLGSLILPGVLGMFIAFGTLLMIQYLITERADGTVLRARTTPHGIWAYFIGKLVTASGTILAYLAVLLIPGLFIIDEIELATIDSWLTLAWVLVLGLMATQSIGVVLGSLVPSPQAAGMTAMPVIALISISGIFYPIAAMPHWLHRIAEIFPVYWLGLGMRSALLPDTMAGVELDHSWRHLETFGVLGAWALIGLLLAPPLLRRMARRESGSCLAG